MKKIDRGGDVHTDVNYFRPVSKNTGGIKS